MTTLAMLEKRLSQACGWYLRFQIAQMFGEMRAEFPERAAKYTSSLGGGN